MTKKEMKKLARKIADAERIIQTTDDIELRNQAENEILKLSGRVKNLADMMALDEIIQQLLEKTS